MDVKDNRLGPFRDCSRGSFNFPLLGSTEIPVTNPGVEWPKGGIFGPLLMFDCDPNLGCLSSLELGIEEPNLFDFISGLMHVSSDQIIARGDIKTGDTKLPPTFSLWWHFFDDSVSVCPSDCRLFLALV